ncbi:MFS transporter [Amycolatopsis magusensis]|uniref:MFS transporter n=1 Tax=Amycolatopsis magusensis TaxID=882444 RepID=UPI0024A86ACF|nr:MFS transporter [Amycolatopsis magusensis]MDI5980326.1 MFS transporter [Amycolatopsis magusensis]
MAYAVGSLVCAFAPNLLVLVLGRVIMGVGAAAIPVLSIIAVTKLLPPDKRGTGIGVVSAAAGSEPPPDRPSAANRSAPRLARVVLAHA